MDLKLKEITWLRLVSLLIWTLLVMLKRGLTQLIEVIEGRIFDRGSQSSSEEVRGETIGGARLLPPLSDEFVLTRIWPLLHREVNVSLLWRLRRVSRAWKESVATTLEWAALEVVRVDSPGYIRYLRGRGERRSSLQERVKDELRAISVLLSERLEDFTPQSEKAGLKKSSCECDNRDWNSTNDAVDLVGACRLEGYPYCGNACSCDGSVCDQDEGRGSEEECVTSSGSSLRTYFPRHLMRV